MCSPDFVCVSGAFSLEKKDSEVGVVDGSAINRNLLNRGEQQNRVFFSIGSSYTLPGVHREPVRAASYSINIL